MSGEKLTITYSENSDFKPVTVEDAIERAYQRGKREGIQQGRADRETEIIHIIEQMKESASAMMWTEREVACEKILEQIKEEENADNSTMQELPQ